MIKVSVIIPCYNVENYVSACLESVLCQTLKDFEIICIDDCSTDSTYKILCDYERKQKNMKLIKNKANRGLSYTRNRGIAVARGKYLYFLDSDDTIEQHALEKLYERAEKDSLDGVLFEARVLEHGQEKYVIERSKKLSGVLTGQETMFLQAEDFGLDFFCAWSSFWNREYIIKNNISFYEGIFHEDILFCFNVMISAKKVACIHEKFYNYNIHAGTITSVPISWRHIQSLIVIIDELLRQYYSNDYTSKIQAVIAQYITNVYNHLYDKLKISKRDFKNTPLEPQFWHCQKTLFFLQSMIANHRKEIVVQPSASSVFSLSEKQETLKKYKHLVVYGAGKVGRRILFSLIDAGFENLTVVVTDNSSDRQSLLGVEIKKLSELAFSPAETLVIIGVGKKLKETVQNNARQAGYKNILEI